MIYDPHSELDVERARARLEFLIGKQRPFELTDKSVRSLDQNSYCHLICGALGTELGESTEYVKKMYFKELCNPDIFVITKTDRYLGEVKDLRSTKDLTKEEMSLAIDRFLRWASEEGYYLPRPEDRRLLELASIAVGRNNKYV